MSRNGPIFQTNKNFNIELCRYSDSFLFIVGSTSVGKKHTKYLLVNNAEGSVISSSSFNVGRNKNNYEILDSSAYKDNIYVFSENILDEEISNYKVSFLCPDGSNSWSYIPKIDFKVNLFLKFLQLSDVKSEFIVKYKPSNTYMSLIVNSRGTVIDHLQFDIKLDRDYSLNKFIPIDEMMLCKGHSLSKESNNDIVCLLGKNRNLIWSLKFEREKDSSLFIEYAFNHIYVVTVRNLSGIRQLVVKKYDITSKLISEFKSHINDNYILFDVLCLPQDRLFLAVKDFTKNKFASFFVFLGEKTKIQNNGEEIENFKSVTKTNTHIHVLCKKEDFGFYEEKKFDFNGNSVCTSVFLSKDFMV